MLTQVFRRAHLLAPRNLFTFNNLVALEQHLQTARPVYSLVYFRANWNPLCAHTDKEIGSVARDNLHWTFIQVDTDVPQANLIARHYKIKAEPEYVMCLYGDEAGRQIGWNDKALRSKLDKLVEASKESLEFTPTSTWRPYGSAALEFYRRRLKRSRNIGF